jgi:RNA polymerase sigma factor (sigma-70 family)
LEDATINHWLARYRAGDEGGARDLWEHYHGPMTRFARNWLRRRPCDGTEADDVVQEAFAGLFQRLRAGAYPDLAGRAGVERLLTAVVMRAVARLRRNAGRSKRGGAVVLNLRRSAEADDRDLGEMAVDVRPDPAAEAAGSEEFLVILDQLALAGGHLFRVALYRTAGFRLKEIATALGCTTAPVKNYLAAIRRLVLEFNGQPAREVLRRGGEEIRQTQGA